EFERSGLLEALLQGDAPDIFHGEVRQPVKFLHLVDGDDVFVAYGRGGSRLTLEAPACRFAGRQMRGQHLDGDKTMQRRIERLQYDAHAATTDELGHFIVVDAA